MADTEEGKGPISHGNEWEVVSLTASAYAAAPGQENVELNDNGMGNAVEEGEAQPSHAMLMSGHFVYPPSKHINLSVERDTIEVQNLQGIDYDAPKLGANEGGSSNSKDGEKRIMEGLSMPDELHGIPFFDEKGDKLSIPGTEFAGGTTLQDLNLIEKEESMYSASNFSSFHIETETTTGGSNNENTVIPGLTESHAGAPDSDISQFPKPSKEDTNDDTELPCEAWWKRGAASLYAQAKEANTFWSIFIAAVVMGFVVLGQRWQQERWKALQLKCHFNVNDEKLGTMVGPISRFKDAIVGGKRRGTSSTEH